ncbi:MAG TPA: hypothetical protein DDZ40_13100 [Deltaproteobacteria bacterium]|nr:hypothetical protein [Deltaproteobacteria bacterium]
MIHPITILTGLPLAVCGALIALRVFGMELDMYGMVGIIMLTGIARKNGSPERKKKKSKGVSHVAGL